jgi:hypothetical protein
MSFNIPDRRYFDNHWSGKDTLTSERDISRSTLVKAYLLDMEISSEKIQFLREIGFWIQQPIPNYHLD